MIKKSTLIRGAKKIIKSNLNIHMFVQVLHYIPLFSFYAVCGFFQRLGGTTISPEIQVWKFSDIWVKSFKALCPIYSRHNEMFGTKPLTLLPIFFIISSNRRISNLETGYWSIVLSFFFCKFDFGLETITNWGRYHLSWAIVNFCNRNATCYKDLNLEN